MHFCVLTRMNAFCMNEQTLEVQGSAFIVIIQCRINQSRSANGRNEKEKLNYCIFTRKICSYAYAKMWEWGAVQGQKHGSRFNEQVERVTWKLQHKRELQSKLQPVGAIADLFRLGQPPLKRPRPTSFNKSAAVAHSVCIGIFKTLCHLFRDTFCVMVFTRTRWRCISGIIRSW